jgi:hypothetical protein
MSADIISMTTGTLEVCPIVFRRDLGLEGGPVVCLGLMAELVIPHRLRGLGLVARTELTQVELGLMDALGERMLANPFEYLSGEFEETWRASEAGAALAFLSNKHRYSIRVSGVERMMLPRTIFHMGEPVRQLVRDHLIKTLDERASSTLRVLECDDGKLVPDSETATKDMTMPLAAA